MSDLQLIVTQMRDQCPAQLRSRLVTLGQYELCGPTPGILVTGHTGQYHCVAFSVVLARLANFFFYKYTRDLLKFSADKGLFELSRDLDFQNAKY